MNINRNSHFTLDRRTVIIYPSNNALLKRNAEFLSGYLKESIGYRLKIESGIEKVNYKKAIILELDRDISDQEGYVLTVNADNVHIKGQTENGVFYGIQTLRKAIPVETGDNQILLPSVIIKDQPRFSYRGMHLDVGRHFFPIEFIKEYIDLLALHNMNTFHWHLTEDQGWRIEIKKYPKLTEIGSQRKQTVVGQNTSMYDNTPHGGFYTQKQAKEIIKYARERFITVIPEIDLPGHMLAALAAYPEFGCTGGPYEVATRWGVFHDVLCIGNDKTMEFIEDVMSEIIDIFPSKYIHIGGDEAPRTRWETCPKCQARIKAESIKADEYHTAEDRLQSYCMTRIEQFLNSKGRQVIGWDEILEGDITPNATVMSWRGMDGGIKAAQSGHDVIMTPHIFAYFDYYQTADTKNEPLAIGGCLPIEKVYGLEPIPPILTNDQKIHILGVQANLWTEYIPTTQQVEYMLLPRIAAMAEVQWTQPENKDYKDFSERLLHLMQLYKRNGLNYAQHIFGLNVKFTPESQTKAINIELSTVDNASVYYTLDGTDPAVYGTKYASSLYVTTNTNFRAVAIRKEGKSREVVKKISFSKATTQPVELKTRPTDEYTSKGAVILTDGLTGDDNYATGDWLGFLGRDADVIIDLEKEIELSHVTAHVLVDLKSWIMGCAEISVDISSDGKLFHEVKSKMFPTETDIEKKEVTKYKISFASVMARYVRVHVKHSLALPMGHVGAGKTPYLFVSEISID
jgi:hexosaminidase